MCTLGLALRLAPPGWSIESIGRPGRRSPDRRPVPYRAFRGKFDATFSYCAEPPAQLFLQSMCFSERLMAPRRERALTPQSVVRAMYAGGCR